jgi:hypothetical protein
MRQDPIYTVTKRVIGLAAHTTSTIVETFSQNGITLNSFPGYASLTAAFDQYRFDVVEFEYLPRLTTADGVLANPGIFITVTDLDDVTALASVGAALEYPNAQVWTPSPGKAPLLKHRFVPHAALAAYKGTFTGYANVSNMWMDVADADIAHYGVKAASTLTASVFVYDILITANISFRSSR